ncbi:MAG: ATP-dependent protease subunit HslV [Deltaproteobacteria bacterium]|jgi:ATP-dependent HslUV protease subunit HslV|nr:ATP-dependent protease subunit HslV [Deltaproteobacteria bacterium]
MPYGRSSREEKHRSTTILMVRHNGTVAVAGDGQVTIGQCALKHTARKIRRLYQNKIICGFAGSTSDALTILERFEDHLSQYSGNFTRAAVELTKKWRTDRGLRHLEAVLIAADKEKSLFISGSGDVVEPDDNLLATGSGGFYAIAAARALVRHAPHLDAVTICRESLKIASEICVYTNGSVEVETLESAPPDAPAPDAPAEPVAPSAKGSKASRPSRKDG